MKEYTVEILKIEELTHDVRRIVTEKPDSNYTFEPGQATEVAVTLPDMKTERRPFTFTSKNSDENLEFIIKVYHTDGVTDIIGKLQEGNKLLVHDVWGAISYKGPGYFLAGGAGITPFLAMLRQLAEENNIDGNMLFFSNKTKRDIILEDELKHYLGDNAIFTLTRENHSDYENGHIDIDMLKKHNVDFSKYFYVCGTPKMTNELVKGLKEAGVPDEKIVYEH
ncbi:MAG TPA: FAD-binding oxidoreductase [Bacteroidales bacterium]|nr:FAD-binding oxidoreductase [Bacteroidales bacterium]